MYDYIVTSLRAYDALLASMAQLEEEMLDKFEGSTPAPRFGDSTSIAIDTLRETIAGIEGGRADINALLKELRAKNESEGLLWRSPRA